MSVWAAGLSLFTLCLSLGETPFTLNVTQDVYQAEEHGNTTLTWLFPVKPDTHSLYIDIMYVRPERRIYLYDSEHELELYPHELYRGRVWCDLELAKKGRIECLFTDLKLNDTGTYQVLVIIDEYHGYKTCDLNVTASTYQPLNVTPKPESRGQIGLFVGLAAFTVLTLVILCQRVNAI